uniref:Uncharacterized protein n=1 Tax=Dicentrarchus labrax TaxID=13489 RepID=A0A8P4G7E3_DICLA
MTSFPMGMNALFHRFHYFISQLVRGKDHVCACTCGRHQVYHVVPYNEVQSMVVSRENNFLSDILTQQKMDVIVGLFLGICISYVLLWLNRVWFPGFKIWRADQMNGDNYTIYGTFIYLSFSILVKFYYNFFHYLKEHIKKKTLPT